MSDEIDQILEAFLQESLPMIERTVDRALRDGRGISELAFDLERGVDEKVRGGCAPRAAVSKRWRTHPELTEDKRNEIADQIDGAKPDDLPVVLSILIERYKVTGVERLMISGVKIVEGDIVTTGKPN